MGLVAENAAATQSSSCSGIGMPVGCRPIWGAAPAWERSFSLLMSLGDASGSHAWGVQSGFKITAGFGGLQGPRDRSGVRDLDASGTPLAHPRSSTRGLFPRCCARDAAG